MSNEQSVNKYWDNFNKGNYEECRAIIWCIDKRLITVEMFDKALEVKALNLCNFIIKYIKINPQSLQKCFGKPLSMGWRLLMCAGL